MVDLILSNWLLWINIAIPFTIALYFVLTNRQYTWVEFLAQVGLTSGILVLFFFIGYSNQDITTTSYESGRAYQVVYEEEWDELVHYQESYSCGTPKIPRTCYRSKTRIDNHPDDFYLKHDFGTSSISESQYRLSAREFGYTQTDSGHSGQVSHGDGRTFVATPNKIIPVVQATSGINYVYASRSNIIKSNEYKDLETQYKSELVAYPPIYEDKYGNRTFNRVINGHLVHPDIRKALDTYLAEYASIQGRVKEVNPIIYFTTATSRDFTYVIKGFYKDAHKNDAVLVVSIDKNTGDLNWVDSFGFTKSAEFFTANRSIQSDMGAGINFKHLNVNGTSDVMSFVMRYRYNIDHYWKRTPMEDFKYLAGDIDLPLGYEIFLVLINLIGSAALFRFMMINPGSKDGTRYYNNIRFWDFIPLHIREAMVNFMNKLKFKR